MLSGIKLFVKTDTLKDFFEDEFIRDYSSVQNVIKETSTSRCERVDGLDLPSYH